MAVQRLGFVPCAVASVTKRLSPQSPIISANNYYHAVKENSVKNPLSPKFVVNGLAFAEAPRWHQGSLPDSAGCLMADCCWSRKPARFAWWLMICCFPMAQ